MGGEAFVRVLSAPCLCLAFLYRQTGGAPRPGKRADVHAECTEGGVHHLLLIFLEVVLSLLLPRHSSWAERWGVSAYIARAACNQSVVRVQVPASLPLS